jgi:ferric enterobactin receptor
MRKFILVAGLLVGAVDGLRAQDSSRLARDSTHARLLTEVTVTTHAPTIRNGPEKKVFTVSQSLVSLGGTAADLLQNVPTLQVDANGNLSLRGETNLKVLVDGKRSLIGGGTIAQVLQSIPASSIDRIEIITNPSAKYDAEGGALVNIILKKNNRAGLNGSVAVTGGTRDNYNAAASISDQKGGVNWNANYSYQHRNTHSNGYQDMTYLVPQPEAVYYSNETFPSVTNTELHSAKAGVDYTLTARDGLSVSGAYDASTKDRNEWLTVDNLTAAGLPVELIRQNNSIRGYGNSYELTVDYTHRFRQPQKELDFDLDYARGVTNNQAIYNTDDSTSVLNDSKIARSRNYNIQLDYSTPAGKAGKLEMGYRSQIGTADNRQLDDEVGNNFFKSTSQVHALYLNFRRQIGTLDLQLGVRGELGRFDGRLQSFDSTGQWIVQPVRVNTQGLYPSLLLIKRLGGGGETGEGRQLQLSYSRRVNRPTPGELNPFFDVSDPVNYDAGNPRLLPEDIHNVELTYKHSRINVGAYFTQVNDVIKHIQTVPVNDVVYTIAENLNRAINTGLEFIGNFHLVRFWDFTANVNLFERINDGDSAFGITPTQGLSWNVNLTNNFSLARNLALQVRADYKASELIIQDRYRPTYGIDGALRYDFWHRKASLALNGRDIFNTRRWTFLREDETLLLNFQRVTYSARVSLTFAYHFGGGGSGGGARKGVEVQENKRIENR